MRRFASTLLAFLVLVGSAAANPIEAPAWGEVFAASGVTGTFVLKDLDTGATRAWNPARAAVAMAPASTYKIMNALIALETGAVGGPDAVIPWDGVKRRVEAWNRDHTLRSAFAVSAVGAFEELARREGPEAIRRFLAEAGYGNAAIGDGAGTFWLDGRLRISALGQVAFLERLHRGTLPFSQATQDIVRGIMVVERGPTLTLRAKTGWANDTQPPVGWWVGLVEKGGRAWAFALNIDLHRAGDAKLRETIARAILAREGIL